jgi:hypothetical protein
MLTFPKESPWLRDGPADLVSSAAAILAREAQNLPGSVLQAPVAALPTGAFANPANHAYPVASAVPLPTANADQLRQQAHELLAGVFAVLGQNSPLAGAYSGASSAYADPKAVGNRKCPVTHAAVPLGGFDTGSLQSKAHELIEMLMAAFALPRYAESAQADDRVPLIHCPAPVQAGSTACASFTVLNDEPAPSEVTLYTSNFIADSAYEIPAVRVSASPRTRTIPPRGRETFEIKIAVPQQTPIGIYSGLIQAMGTKYVKAVLSVEVR